MTALFFRSLLNDPLHIGAVAPSSPFLAQRMAAYVTDLRGPVVEVGPGTGAITRALLERGIAERQLYLIEKDRALARYLRREFPGVCVLCGDAVDTVQLLHSRAVRNVPTVVSGLPLRNFSNNDRNAVVLSMMDALSAGGQLLQFTYGVSCPLRPRTLGLRAEYLGRIWRNLPPAAVWKFSRAY